MKDDPHRVVTAWHLHSERRKASYLILLFETGLFVRAWGSTNKVTQARATEFVTFDKARDCALKNLYGKLGKGYRTIGEPGLHFTAPASLLARIARNVEALNEETQIGSKQLVEILGAWQRARSAPAEGLRDSVLTHYVAFREQVHQVMEDVSANRDPATSLYELSRLDNAWSEIEEQHSLAKAALDTAKQMIASRAIGATK